ncbi:PREDICTED: uncharacterized protein LOC108660628 [Theobroma cacao]|uniref:Uncharacterized protein LOC108660628 n=1 Tax=Theobroma cacao TaxID=3641 RepID=A0AB32VWX5_THECC|nr:PREDICTED: uncharacterized protein LOC108660628 [Theobroma cacao]
MFSSKVELKRALHMLVIKEKFAIKVKRSCKARYKVGCKDKACKYNVRATKLPDRGEYWKVQIFHKVHTCTVDGLQEWFPTMSTKMIGELMSHKIQANGVALRPKDLIYEMRVQWGFECLHVIAVATDEEERFKYCFWSYEACIRGFRDAMRPMVAIDATHLKGRFKGILFVIVCKDANECVYPVVFSIGHVEDKDSWMWFLSKLRDAHARQMSITVLIEFIRDMFQRWFHERYEELVQVTTPLSPWVTSKYNREAIEFCTDYYNKIVFVEGYSGSIMLVGHPSEWDIPPYVKQIVVVPPPWRGQAGRPRRRRIPSAGEDS